VLAAAALREFDTIDSSAKTKKTVKMAIEQVAARLGNTVTICRKCYVHPEIISAYLTGTLAEELQKDNRAELDKLKGLSPDEAAVLLLLEKRLKAGNPFHEAVEKLGLEPKRRSRKAAGT
jgi:DNA topoisomerase-1